MNKTLLFSSIFLALIHLIYMAIIPGIKNTEYFRITMIGIITSILNHGLTSDEIKNLDRGMMYFLFFYNLNIQYKYKLLFPFICSVSGATCYYMAKITDNTDYHLLGHFLALVNNLSIMNYLTYNVNQTSNS